MSHSWKSDEVEQMKRDSQFIFGVIVGAIGVAVVFALMLAFTGTGWWVQ